MVNYKLIFHIEAFHYIMIGEKKFMTEILTILCVFTGVYHIMEWINFPLYCKAEIYAESTYFISFTKLIHILLALMLFLI
jgi:hypothetical protein